MKVIYMFTQDKLSMQFPQEIEWDVSIPMTVFIEDHVPATHPVGFNISFYAPVYINVWLTGGRNQSNASGFHDGLHQRPCTSDPSSWI